MRLVSLTLLIASCALVPQVAAQAKSAGELLGGIPVERCSDRETFVFAAHGGAIFWRNDHPRKVAFLETLLPEARAKLAAGATALDVVHGAMVAMEDSGAFNAGKGSIANKAGVVEMDASIMDGSSLAAGAVASVKGLKNPVDAARIVLERSDHVMMVGADAEAFISGKGGEVVENGYFLHGGGNFSDVPLPPDLAIVPPVDVVTPERARYSGLWAGVWQGQLNHVLAVERIQPDDAQVVYASGVNEYWGEDEAFWLRFPAAFQGDELRFTRTLESGIWNFTYRLNADDTLSGTAARERDGLKSSLNMRRWTPPDPTQKGGTIGAVALDRCGNLAAGTSTGGFGSKTPGRVGDSPVIGAGTYADNGTAAISATGHGETFIRRVAAYDIVARMRYKDLTLEQAASEVIEDGGLRGGVIAVDAEGNVTMPFSTIGMVRGMVRELGKPVVELY